MPILKLNKWMIVMFAMQSKHTICYSWMHVSIMLGCKYIIQKI